MGIIADIDNPLLASFPLANKDPASFEINSTKRQIGGFFNSQSASENQPEHDQAAYVVNRLYQLLYFGFLRIE